MASGTCTVPKKPVGRPEKEIDWKLVDDFLEIGATGVQIASYFSIHPETFYDRVKQKYNMVFTDYAGSVAPKGELQLLATQYKYALKGNTQLLMMLGQERLGQGKKDGSLVTHEDLTKFETIMGMLETAQKSPAVQSSDLNKADSNNSAETKS